MNEVLLKFLLPIATWSGKTLRSIQKFAAHGSGNEYHKEKDAAERLGKNQMPLTDGEKEMLERYSGKAKKNYIKLLKEKYVIR